MAQILNDAQSKAVSHFEGPMLVLAGPGSGKTRVITERIRYLVQEKGVYPASILVITFTRASAMEMKQRYQGLSSGHSGGVHFGTFHAIFFMILKNSSVVTGCFCMPFLHHEYIFILSPRTYLVAFSALLLAETMSLTSFRNLDSHP